MVNHHFTTTIWELWFICSKASWNHGLLQNQRRGLVCFARVAFIPSASKDLSEGKTTKICPKKDLEFQQVFGSPVDFLLQSPGSEFTVVLVGQRRKNLNILLMFQKSGEKTLLICRIRNYLQGFYTSQVVIAGFLPSTKQWEKLSQNLSEWHISFLQLIRKTRWSPDVFFLVEKT